ncbi:phosphopantetheine-binding protein [Streptomyces armeniacus]|uniref:phosphopantetheine-binding protein n=1 Tax=Streptomyces armeniacus TaxID=83291 RepID=UPI001AD7F80D|nr:phosphopantetheine-binding protein [Streptomyces armeniacus]
MNAQENTAKLVSFIQENLLTEDTDLVIDEATPLMELGILNSLKTAILLNYINHGLGLTVPPERLSAANFQTPRTIAAMIDDLAAAAKS